MGQRLFLIALLWYSASSGLGEQPSEPKTCRQRIFQALTVNHIIESSRILVHYSHTCDLSIDRETYPVVDVRELVKNAKEPRGVNRIVVFTSEWRRVQTIDYVNERPLFCLDNTLYVYGEIRIAAIGTYNAGNVIVFRDHARKISLKNVDWVSLPVLGVQKKK